MRPVASLACVLLIYFHEIVAIKVPIEDKVVRPSKA